MAFLGSGILPKFVEVKLVFGGSKITVLRVLKVSKWYWRVNRSESLVFLKSEASSVGLHGTRMSEKRFGVVRSVKGARWNQTGDSPGWHLCGAPLTSR